MIKFYKIENTIGGRKLLSLINKKWTNQKFANRTSKPVGKRTDGSLTEKESFRRLVS